MEEIRPIAMSITQSPTVPKRPTRFGVISTASHPPGP
jgi:hypothetical protein